MEFLQGTFRLFARYLCHNGLSCGHHNMCLSTSHEQRHHIETPWNAGDEETTTAPLHYEVDLDSTKTMHRQHPQALFVTEEMAVMIVDGVVEDLIGQSSQDADHTAGQYGTSYHPRPQ